MVLLGGVADPRQAASVIAELFGDGPVVVGPVAADLAGGAGSARAAVSAYRSAPGWPDAPRPVLAWELLAERALGGDGHARRQLVDDVYLPLLHARGALVETLTAWLDRGSSIEGAARALFVHPNTVRYRLRQVADLTGLTPGQRAGRVHAPDRPGAGPPVRPRLTSTQRVGRYRRAVALDSASMQL